MALDKADLEAINKLIADAGKAQSEALTTALQLVGGRLDKVEKVEPPDVDAIIARALEAMKADPKDPKDKDPNKGKLDAESLARLAGLEEKLEKANLAAENAESKAAQESMLGHLRTALLAAKVPANRVNHAIALLHNAEGRVALNDAGQATLRFDRTSAAGAYKDHALLPAGVEEWLATDDGKAFMPAAQVRGADTTKAGPKGITTPGKDGKVNIDVRSIKGALLSANIGGGGSPSLADAANR